MRIIGSILFFLFCSSLVAQKDIYLGGSCRFLYTETIEDNWEGFYYNFLIEPSIIIPSEKFLHILGVKPTSQFLYRMEISFSSIFEYYVINIGVFSAKEVSFINEASLRINTIPYWLKAEVGVFYYLLNSQRIAKSPNTYVPQIDDVNRVGFFYGLGVELPFIDKISIQPFIRYATDYYDYRLRLVDSEKYKNHFNLILKIYIPISKQ